MSRRELPRPPELREATTEGMEITQARTRTEPSKNTSATLPEPLLTAFYRFRLEQEADGERLKVAKRLNEAILSLPSDAVSLVRLFAEHSHRLNLGVRPGDVGFIPEGRMTFRVALSAERHVATLMRNCYDLDRRRLHRQDLFALALSRLLNA